MIIGSQKLREQICSTNIYRYSCFLRNGKPANYDGSEFYIPSLIELRNFIFSELFKLGISNIERVSPAEANCIIRVFHDLNHTASSGFTYNIYGANCYILRYSKWITGEKQIPINFSEHIQRHWISGNNYIDFDCEFIDFYVKISSN